MNAAEGYQKLKEHYPNYITPGLILGDALAIVGQFGLTICYIRMDFTQSRFKFEENEKLPIIRFTDNSLFIIPEGFSDEVAISYEKFKGFSFKNKLFV